MEKQTRNKANLYDGLIFLCGSIGLLIYSLVSYNAAFLKDWSQSPYLFPLIISVCVGILSTALIIQGVKKEAQSSEMGVLTISSKPNYKGVAVVIAIVAVYYAALTMIKTPIVTVMIFSLAITISIFEVSTILFLFILMWYLGVRKAPVLILTPLLATLFISIAFRTLLHVLLP
jgi:hypothetical protein